MSPWVARALARELPAADRTGAVYVRVIPGEASLIEAQRAARATARLQKDRRS